MIEDPLKAACLTTMAALLVLGGCREPNPNPMQSTASTVPAAVAEEDVEFASADDKGRPGVDGAIASTLCNIEFVDGAAFGATPTIVGPQSVVRGWLGHDVGVPAAPRFVVADAAGTRIAEYPLRLETERPDVVQAYGGLASLGRSGFQIVLGRLEGTPPFHLYLIYHFGPSTYICDNGRHVVPAT